MIGVPQGTVVAIRGGIVRARLPALCVGATACILTRAGGRIAARVTTIEGRYAALAPAAGVEGIAAGDCVVAGVPDEAFFGSAALGRAVDAMGTPLDGGPAVRGVRSIVHDRLPSDRAPIRTPFWTGVAAIDGPLAFGAGARIGLFGGPGCGKSTLLETLAGATSADVTVVALVGERGREAERWLARIDARTTIVCATSDRSPAERVRAAEVAFAQAEALRRRGLHVLLILDSLARVAAAARDLAVAAGEPAGRGGYPPSVFGRLAGLLERAGRFEVGSITLVATVLTDGADERDPVSEACRAALDGHIVLSDRLARQGWFPAIDVPASASRTIGDIAAPEHLAGARALRGAVALLDETREARQFGLDPGVGNPAVRRAIDAESAIADFLRRSGRTEPDVTLTELATLTDRLTNGYFR